MKAAPMTKGHVCNSLFFCARVIPFILSHDVFCHDNDFRLITENDILMIKIKTNSTIIKSALHDAAQLLNHPAMMFAVIVLTPASSPFWHTRLVPATIITAIVSPIARPKDNSCQHSDFAAGSITVKAVLSWLAPSARPLLIIKNRVQRD